MAQRKGLVAGQMIATSANDFLVISDSDILVRPDFLRNVIPPLLTPPTAW